MPKNGAINQEPTRLHAGEESDISSAKWPDKSASDLDKYASLIGQPLIAMSRGAHYVSMVRPLSDASSSG